LTTEFAMTMVLVVGLAVSLRSIEVTRRAQVSIETKHLLTTWITLPNRTYATPDQRATFLDRLNERLFTIPSISALGFATVLPFNGAVTRPLIINGLALQAGDTPAPVSTVSISAGYFDALDVKLREGRMFDGADGTPGHENAIVNERLAQMFFGDGVPLGRHIRLGDTGTANASPWLTVVGVSPNVRQRTQGLLPDPVVYVPLAAAPPADLALIARTASTPAALVSPLREAVRALDPGLPFYRTKTMEEVINQSLWNTRMSQDILATIALIGLLLSAVGLYAVAAHAVADRTREIGLRMALGAQRAHVMWSVLRGAMWQLGAGVVLGTFGSVLWDQPWVPRNADAQLQPRAIDATILISVVLVLAAVALVACYVPARRATEVDPMVALRCE
jgi:predicted permease